MLHQFPFFLLGKFYTPILYHVITIEILWLNKLSEIVKFDTLSTCILLYFLGAECYYNLAQHRQYVCSYFLSTEFSIDDIEHNNIKYQNMHRIDRRLA